MALALRALAATLLLVGCARPRVPAPAPIATGPAPAPMVPAEGDAPRARPLPAIPRMTGKLEIRIVYPPPAAPIAGRDSQFIFGSVGSGDGLLAINGVSVEVRPNGSFLAFLPVPSPDKPFYQVEVARGADTVRLRHPASPRRPVVELREGGPVLADSASVSPRGVQSRMPDESVRMSVRAAPDADVRFLRNGQSVNMRPLPGDRTHFQADVPTRLLDGTGALVITRGRDSVTLPAPRVGRADSAGRVLAALGAAPSTLPDTDRVIVARPVQGGTYKWFLLPGTVVEVTGRTGDALRVRLDSGLDAWVDASEAGWLASGGGLPQPIVGNARVLPGTDGEWTDVVLPMAAPPAYSVDATARGVALTLHGVVVNTDIVNYAAGDSLVDLVTWQQELRDRGRFDIVLREPLFGYLVLWRPGALVLRLRRAPAVDIDRPLSGLRIAVDAGHPPAGSTGPTGLYEAVATLAIAERLRTLLEVEGATVVMPRTGPSALALGDRPLAARRANAHAFVSIHLNAPPDGVDPYRVAGTGTYYFTPHSAALARRVQRGMVRRLGLPDRGINYDNLAVIRPTWMPAVLCEGAYLVIPEQEAALRTPEFQDAYARGVAEGLVDHFRTLARSGAPAGPNGGRSRGRAGRDRGFQSASRGFGGKLGVVTDS